MSVSIGMIAMMMLAMVSTAQAQPPKPSWRSALRDKDSEVDLHIKRGWAVVDAARLGKCQGYTEGATKIVGRALVMKDGACTVYITFDRNYTRANLTENNCLNMHGASCQFDISNLRRRYKDK